MKIEVRLENGKPILFFPEYVNHDKTIVCYAELGGDSRASRAYMRSLPKPITSAERIECWLTLARYAEYIANHQ